MFRVDTLSISSGRAIVIGVFQLTRCLEFRQIKRNSSQWRTQYVKTLLSWLRVMSIVNIAVAPVLPLVSLYNWGAKKLGMAHRSKVGEEYA